MLVAVIDSGVDASHPDLQGRVSAASRSYIQGYGPFDDDSGHGTFIAGLIAAVANNGLGIAGVASDATLLAMKTSKGKNSDQSVTAQAILDSVEEGASVLNLSFGSPSPNEVQMAAINVATGAPYNAIIIAAAGNSGDGDNPMIFPASFPHVTSVGSVNSDGFLTSFSQTNELIDVVAPGGMVFSLLAGTVSPSNLSCGGTPYDTPTFSAVYETPYDCLLLDGVRSDVFYQSGSGTSYSSRCRSGRTREAEIAGTHQ